jgi:ubiquinone/menaquinone biosynthesis C-methylase UbiE
MNPEEKAVGHHYDEGILTYELERLEKHSRVEFLLTLRALARWVPSTRGVAVDIGVGSGAYSSWLAARGFRVHLVDVSAKLLDATMERLKREGSEAQILGRHHRSATDLDTLPDECADVLLALGPLYHLREADDRRKAVCEAARILKPNGLLFAAGINRMAFLRDAFRHSPGKGALLRESCLKFLEDGQLDPDTAPPIGFAHLTTATEFGGLFVEAFERIALWGVDAFTSPAPEKLVGLSREDCEAWLDVVERAAPLPDALGYTDHFLYVGRRAKT